MLAGRSGLKEGISTGSFVHSPPTAARERKKEREDVFFRVGTWGEDDDEEDWDWQIGRASCRERVLRLV